MPQKHLLKSRNIKMKQAWKSSTQKSLMQKYVPYLKNAVHQPGPVPDQQWLPSHMADSDFRSTSSQPVENLRSQN